jgi:hypothetical protein
MAKLIKKAQNGDTIQRASKMDLQKQRMRESYKSAKPSYDKQAANDARNKANEAADKPKKSVYDAPSFAPTGPRPKKKNGGSLSGLKASGKRVGPVDAKGAWTKVQEKTLAGAKGKAVLKKDKELGATKMSKKK